MRAGQAFLVRVAQRVGSVPGTFKLVFDAAAPEVRPPGRLLGRHGATDTLDRVLKPADAFSYRMRARHDLPHQLRRPSTCRACTRTTSRPAARDWTSTRRAPGTSTTTRCAASAATATSSSRPAAAESGRYPLRVLRALVRPRAQRFHLQIAPADASDTAPGLPLTNHQRAHGALRARAWTASTSTASR